MKVIENEPFKPTTTDDPERPYWQNFMFEICKAIGVDPTKQPVSNIEIQFMGGRLPRIIVTIEPYSHRELQPIIDIFQSAEWKNSREEPKPDIEEISRQLAKMISSFQPYPPDVQK